ncbi:Protein virilizer homolog [Linum perenne]
MGRPEPCVLFSQTFVHPQLDEYVDEVLFGEPVVITACEFLEQNAPSASQVVSLVGATAPPSFALEVFVQSEGETRFRRLCQPFLYSHSSSNVLEVEAVVTNHLVVRGSYRSLTLVIYGNMAEDLGQFNIEFDDNSLTNLVTSAEGKLEDLPLALHSGSRVIEESLISLKVLSLPLVDMDISVEVKQFLQLISKMLEMPLLEDSVYKVVSTIVTAVCSHVAHDSCREIIGGKDPKPSGSKESEEFSHIIDEAKKELLGVLQCLGKDVAHVLVDSSFLESEGDLATSKELVDMFSQHLCFDKNSSQPHELVQNKNFLGLCVAFLLCSGRESCFHFVNQGGIEQLAHFFSHEMPNSSAVVLLLLGVIERATRHPIGCEAILGWWPREDENVPTGFSKGYSQLLKLFLEKPRHDVASLATYILHRLRVYEVASRYESAVLSALAGLAADVKVTNHMENMLESVKFQLKKLLKLINSFGPIEDPSPVAHASRSLILGQTEGQLSYKATSSLIDSSACSFFNCDIDSHLLGLLKERGFLPLSAALLSSPLLRSDLGDTMGTFAEISSTIGAILLSLLMRRSGLLFLSNHPELSTILIEALRNASGMRMEECLPLRYASILSAKGFVCGPREVGTIIEMHLRVVNAIDRLLLLTPHTEEFLWVLWELCGLSRSDCGRQALLALGCFPEVISTLIEALHAVKETEPDAKGGGASPIDVAIFHSAAEIFEAIVTDSTASSLKSWIGHVMELYKALNSSSPGSNRKDAPTRLLDWIDAGVVYHKNGAIGLLRYSAALASGGDTHLTSASTLVSDLTDVENVVSDASGGPDINVMENLAKMVSEKTFEGVTFRDSAIPQLTTAIRIMAFISENSTVAANLYDDGALTVIYAVVVNCSFMLEKSSNIYDYLVDEGAEGNSTSDLLLERNREQSLVDLLVPSLLLLITLLHKLQEAKEQHRNTKLMNALLRLHREVSPKLAACTADLSSSYPDSALGFGAVCHLTVSALSFWPVYGWTPGLFHTLLANVQASSLLGLGPKETCSLLCLLVSSCKNNLFPEEGVWLWKNGMPLLSALRMLAAGTLLGPHKERQINWYLEPSHLEKLLNQLSPQLEKIAQIVKHYAISSMVVIQDMLRIFIIRIACQKVANASVLLQPILSSIRDHLSDFSSLSEIDAYKVYKYLAFLASVLEHPRAKVLLLEKGIADLLSEALERCFTAIYSDGYQFSESTSSAKIVASLTMCCVPAFKSIALLCGAETALLFSGQLDFSHPSLSSRDCSQILPHLLKFCQVLPVGRELLSCLISLKELGSCSEGQSALLTFWSRVNGNSKDLESEMGDARNGNHAIDDFEWSKNPPLLCSWRKLLKSVDSMDGLSTCAVEAINALSVGSLSFCVEDKSLNCNAVAAIKYLYGIPNDLDEVDSSSEAITAIEETTTMLNSKITNSYHVAVQATLYQALESANSLLLLLQKPSGSVTLDEIGFSKDVLLSNNILASSTINEMDDDYVQLGGLADKFLWECPETMPDRLAQNLPAKRKMTSVDSSGKRVKGENSVVELTGQSTMSRGMGPSTASTGPMRRDTFRQRKPNTSRPPSMHVDDYVARERSVDVGGNSSVIAVQRVGSSGGRPPSIHVDEFMARERERQNPMAAVVGESSQVKATTVVNDVDKEKTNKSKQLKTDMDTEFHGMDIVFDAEESETDDKSLFPQPDDNLQQPTPVMLGQSSPQSIVEETGSDVNLVASKVDENAQSEFSSRMSAARPEMPLTREPSVTSDKKFYDQSDDLKNAFPSKTSMGVDSVTGVSVYNSGPASSMHLPLDSRNTPSNVYMKNSPHNATGSRGGYDHRIPMHQPPLPPMPPPSTVSPVIHQSPSRSSPFLKPLAEVQSDYPPAYGNSPASHGIPDSKYSRSSVSSPSGSAGPHPPLPPTPPPFSAGPYNLPSGKSSNHQSAYSDFQQTSGLTSYAPPQLMPPLGFSRPTTVPSLYANPSSQQSGDNQSMLQNISMMQSSVQSMHQLQPLQPPLQRPSQAHLWPPLQPSQQQQQQLEQGLPLQNPFQVPVHQLQMLQQPQQMPTMHTHYQAQQQQQQQLQVEQGQHSQGDASSSSQQQRDMGMSSLQDYFKDPQAITALLSNKEELCRLLEQHPKLMQMLQERLGQQ